MSNDQRSGDGSRQDTPDIRALERRLDDARARTLRAVEALRPKHRGGEMEEFRAAVDAQHEAERALALERGEPAAMALPWEPRWDVGVPAPHVLSSGRRTLLLYRVHETDPGWDGSTAQMVDVTDGTRETIATVSFVGCYAYRFGGPNDEVIHGHPLYGRGLEAYRAHRVQNSPWITQERQTNSVHAQFRPEQWENRVHYLLTFHDDLFECIARSYEVKVMRSTFKEAVDVAAARLFER